MAPFKLIKKLKLNKINPKSILPSLLLALCGGYQLFIVAVGNTSLSTYAKSNYHDMIWKNDIISIGQSNFLIIS